MTSFLCGLVLLSASQVPPSGVKPMPPELLLVPESAAVVGHVKAAELYRHPSLKLYRTVFETSGKRALAQFDERVVPTPSNIERITLVLLPGEKSQEFNFANLIPVVILACKNPVDIEQLKKVYVDGGTAKQAGGQEYFLDRQKARALAVVGPTTVLFGIEIGVQTMLKNRRTPGVTAGELQPTLDACRDKPFVVSVNIRALPIPGEVFDNLPAEFRPATRMNRLLLSAELGTETNLKLHLPYADATVAIAAEKAWVKINDAGRNYLDAYRQTLTRGLIGDKTPIDLFSGAKFLEPVAMLAALNLLDDELARFPVERTNETLVVTLKVPPEGTQFVAAAALATTAALPAIQGLRNQAASAVAVNNLKQIGIAMHNYHDSNGRLPLPAIMSKKGKPLLSWRVAILPYIEQDNLYRKFKLDEPWDSEHNKPLGEVAIKTYTDPRSPLGTPPNHTFYKVFVGKQTVFDRFIGTKLQSIPDGTSNTLMVAAAGMSVPWSKPADIDYDPTADYTTIAKAFDDEFIFAMGDGSVRTVNLQKLIDPAKTLRRLIEKDDGQVFNIEERK